MTGYCRHTNTSQASPVLVQLLCVAVFIGSSGCAPLTPRSIEAQRWYQCDQLIDGHSQIQRGKPYKVLDCAGWVLGIPGKIILWDRRIDNHRLGPETEQAISQYLETNNLTSVRVRLNQYAPRDDWRRLVSNKSVAAPWRYTLGTLSTLYETVIPGRLFGGDHFNPFTNTIHLYSDVPSIALHEGGHAKDFARRKWKGTYAAAYLIPAVPLYHEAIATSDVLAYLEYNGTANQQREARRILYPAYGTYVGSTLGTFFPVVSDPIYLGSVAIGHFWGRQASKRIPINNPAAQRPLAPQPALNLQSPPTPDNPTTPLNGLPQP